MPALKPRVKVCCIKSIDEARLAIGAGASALGLVSAMPSGPGPIDEETIAAIASRVPPPIATFLLTCFTDAEPIVDQQRRTRCNTVQLVDAIEEREYPRLRRQLPGIALVQVIHVCGEESFEQACAIAPHVDALLLDSGNPKLAVKELGGTGRTHDWNVSRRIVERSGRPVFLAGGLNPDNVYDAVDHVRPFGVDLCSGIRTDGELDNTKLQRFMQALEPMPAARRQYRDA
jgi:phosphoribosylanthranilate isomerase